ncbi:hypothetical protein M378DRAFT_752536 [Amanita muscaria Koide BX008]|uniref:NACHT domain-containing protein n=1 Tax=Amanita muscaria (strain Koide BX008) TaxID=946122 RepID=A0A0C2X1T4_AMAMK|nr:hypothetical protein M378DRAFT_752536 [Amanita muscaria Koide BX008]
MSAQMLKSFSFIRKIGNTRNKSREKGISRQRQLAIDGHNPDISIPAPTPQPLPIDHSPGDERDLDISVPSQAPPTTSEPKFIDKDARDERNPDIPIPAQASTTPRPQPVDHSSGDDGHPGVPVPPRGPPQILGDRDAPNGKAARDSELGILITSPAINHSPLEARYEDDNGISNPIETLSITPEHPSIDREGAGVRSKEATHGVDTDFSIPKEASSITTGLHSVDRGDRVVQRGEAPSMSIVPGASNTSLIQIPPTPKLDVITDAGVHFESAHFTGGGHTFGNNSVVNNTFMSGDGQFTEIQRNLICDYIAKLAVLPDINVHLRKHVLTQSIISLPRAKALFDDYQNKKKSGPCFKGTREALLREMADWATGPGESRTYVLSGLAGIGKSTVAYTIASRAADLGLLGASFFFSRDEADRKNAEKVFSTIAYQLCVYNETFAKTIGDVLLTERGSAATTKDPQEQLQVLIVDPLRSIVQSRPRPIIIVVDALDECDEEDGISVLTGLRQLVRDLPSFKVILTTRPQLYLDHFLRNQSGLQIFHLQDIEEKIVDGDIRLYLQHCLSLEEVQRRYPRRQWCASDEGIDSLVYAAGRLFIIASTGVRYIFDKSASNPAAQMQKLLSAFAQAYTPFKDLDHFYTVILRNVVPANCDDDGIVDRYRSVVGAIIFVQRPLPVSTLAHLVNIDVDDIHAVIDHLQSVILMDGDVPHIYHKSFPEYLTDQARCKDRHLQIDPRTHHMQIATRCFEIMDKHLKRNILGLGDPARFMSNEDGLKKDGITDEQLEAKVPQQLRYACVYWVNHFELANIDVDLMNRLEKFAADHMLYWFEVLSLIGKLDSAHRAIRVVLKVLKSTSSNLHQLLSDALRFISKFYETIKGSALHTYYSALPFTPRDSLLYHRYIKDAAHNICAIEGGPEKWDALVANLSHGELVSEIGFSLDSTLFVSCSVNYDDSISIQSQGKLKIWDAATGTPVSTIPGHRFAVANDFSTVASSEEKTITLYNMNGSIRSAMFTTSSNIQRLALSSESSRVAAALSDGTIWLWESTSAKFIDSFDDFEDCGDWSLLGFSSTGARLTYSSPNGIVKLRDGISGRSITDLQCGSSDRRCFECSDDGSRIASLSTDCGLTLWNSESGALTGAVTKSDSTVWDSDGAVWPHVLAISANGSLLATADGDKVTLWSENNNSLAQIEVVELRRPLSMAFSSDNILATATVFHGIKLYDFKTHAFISTLPFHGMPLALAFSRDCTHFAVGGDNGNVDLWDIRGIDASGPLSKGNATAVTSLALSQDCSRLACGFEDGRVELWKTSLIKRRIGPLSLRSKMKTIFVHIFRRSRHTRSVRALEFGPDGRLFASASLDSTIKLWNGKDGSLRGTFKVSGEVRALALSNSVLVAGHGWSNVTLWSLDTLSRIHTFETSGKSVSKVSIADNNALIAVVKADIFFADILDNVVHSVISLLDVVNRTTIATFDIPYHIHKMTFLPDNSKLVAQSSDGVYLSLNLINKHITKGLPLEDVIQLPDTSLCHGVPVWHCQNKDQHYFSALFSGHKSPVPVLWIPRGLGLSQWTQESSMIALGCRDGRVILLRLPTSYVG